MKRTIFICLLCLVAVLAQAQSEPQHEVELVTDSGTIVLALYNDTPKHRDNFLRQVRSGAYNGVLFHRVIKDFMVQTGDLATYSSFCRMESSLTTDIHWCSQQFKRFRDISTFEIVQ